MPLLHISFVPFCSAGDDLQRDNPSFEKKWSQQRTCEPFGSAKEVPTFLPLGGDPTSPEAPRRTPVCLACFVLDFRGHSGEPPKVLGCWHCNALRLSGFSVCGSPVLWWFPFLKAPRAHANQASGQLEFVLTLTPCPR